ncbi:hypothetical protein J4Q44_G00126670 [Coregonus suidteri]|uniref:Sulfite reductase [NADPH] flavoprotein alpha-component-like FAD-binding domain-containing protein n=1 Tax=Coregonus suidteri TaxID=861788 RepID=A0AAN8LXN2_9TELE
MLPRNILAVLEDMPSLHPTIDHLCELLPRLQARYYSIASSCKVYSTMVSICAMVVEFRPAQGGVSREWPPLAEGQGGGDGQRPQAHCAHVRPQVPVPAALQASNPVVMIWGPAQASPPSWASLQSEAG